MRRKKTSDVRTRKHRSIEAGKSKCIIEHHLKLYYPAQQQKNKKCTDRKSNRELNDDAK